MMNCIRCGAGVHLEGRMLTTVDGGYTCPAAMQGEASVHRVQATPTVLPKNRSWGPAILRGVLGFAAGRIAGDILFGGHQPHDALTMQMMQTGQAVPQPTSYVEQAANYISSR